MSWDSITIRRINLSNGKEVAAVRDFLSRFDLRFDLPDFTITLLRDEKILATGSLAGDVLRNIAVDESLQGEGLTATVVTELLREATSRGIFHQFLYTKPTKAHLFTALGFSEIARGSLAAVLECGLGSIEKYLADLVRSTNQLPQENRAALVMNCNPFTRGHLALIETAAKDYNVIIFIVSEDRSLFPFQDRFRLVKAGVSHLSNVAVIKGGKYIISAATFPSYFTREEDVATAQTELDATVFAVRIASPLGIKTRLVGEEPYCGVTASYNASLARILPAHGIDFRVIPRVTAAGQIISASTVREAIRGDDWQTLELMLPPVTQAYLHSLDARPVIQKIKESATRH